MTLAREVSAPLLSVKGLRYAYGSYIALQDISLEVGPDEIVVLVGRNGAGKSTLLRAVAGWSEVAAGKIAVGGVTTRQSERRFRQSLVLVPDRPDFYDDLTTWEHIQFVARVNRKEGWEDRGETLLRRFGLWDSQKAYPFTYSLGMRYKLALCLALLVSPRLLLLDEPFSPLDPISSEELWEVLDSAAAEGMATLLSTHNLPTDATPDRFIILEGGRQIAEGAPDALQARLGLRPGYSLDELLRSAIHIAIESSTINPVAPNPVTTIESEDSGAFR